MARYNGREPDYSESGYDLDPLGAHEVHPWERLPVPMSAATRARSAAARKEVEATVETLRPLVLSGLCTRTERIDYFLFKAVLGV